MNHWSAAFVGLPWMDKGRSREGVDCWGLCRLVYLEVLAITLPSYTGGYACAGERNEIAALMAGNSAQWPWVPVQPEAAREFDMALFQRGGLESHVGIVVNPWRMLHVVAGDSSCVVSFSDGRWKPRLVGVYRHLERRS